MLGNLQRASQLLCHLDLATVKQLWLLFSLKKKKVRPKAVKSSNISQTLVPVGIRLIKQTRRVTSYIVCCFFSPCFSIPSLPLLVPSLIPTPPPLSLPSLFLLLSFLSFLPLFIFLLTPLPKYGLNLTMCLALSKMLV